MKQWVRRQVDELCAQAGDLFAPSFGELPVTQDFSDLPEEGTSENLARADHRHGMPDPPESTLDNLDIFAVFFEDLVLSTPTNVIHQIVSTPAVGGRDDVGHIGAFGSVDLATNATINNTSGAWIRNDTTTTLTARHLWQRTIRLVIRALIPATVAQLPNTKAWVGGIGAFAYTAVTTRIETNLTDGVYFSLSLDGSGVGNWQANAENGGNVTTVDTGRPPVQSGANVEFTTFQIDYDHTTTTATFFIGDSTHVDDDGLVIMDQVASISTNIPTSARKLGGYGIWVENGAGATRTISLDNVYYKGYRVAPT